MRDAQMPKRLLTFLNEYASACEAHANGTAPMPVLPCCRGYAMMIASELCCQSQVSDQLREYLDQCEGWVRLTLTPLARAIPFTDVRCAVWQERFVGADGLLPEWEETQFKPLGGRMPSRDDDDSDDEDGGLNTDVCTAHDDRPANFAWGLTLDARLGLVGLGSLD